MTTATQTQIRRDTATNLNAATPASGELGYDTTNKRLVVGDGSTPGGIKHASAADLQKQSFTYATVGGTADVITLTNSPVVGSYTTGLKQSFKATGTNTTSVTVNVDTLGAKTIKKLLDGALTDLVAGDIVSGCHYEIFYDGTYFQIKGLGVSSQTGALVYLGTVTASGSATVDLTSLMSSTYDDYLVVISNLKPATNGSNLLMQVSDDNGSTWKTTLYCSIKNISSPASTNTASADSDASAWTLATSLYNADGYGLCNGEVKVLGTNRGGTNGPTIVWDMQWTTDNTTSGIRRVSGGGHRRGGTENANALRFKQSSGNQTTGTYKLYGIAKS